MEKVKATKEYTIFKKRNNRYAVKDTNGKWVKADEKIKILLSEKLIKAPAPKKVVEEAPAETATEETATEEAPAEETPAEESPAEEKAAE